jgi:peroxiredoxin Q/BCP
MAPDFTLPGATREGLAAPVRLSALRGQVVVLAFFPRARTSGCTVQMKAYRDQYDSLFKGHPVKVLAVSTDADTTLAAWAKELGTPVTFGSDSAGTVGRAYGALREGARGKADMRHLYVIDPRGRVAHRMVPFNELAADSYTELAAAVARAAGH